MDQAAPAKWTRKTHVGSINYGFDRPALWKWYEERSVLALAQDKIDEERREKELAEAAEAARRNPPEPEISEPYVPVQWSRVTVQGINVYPTLLNDPRPEMQKYLKSVAREGKAKDKVEGERLIRERKRTADKQAKLYDLEATKKRKLNSKESSKAAGEEMQVDGVTKEGEM